MEIKWGCSSRIDTIDDELLNIMSRAGCNTIFFGVESGSQRMQKILKKNLDLNIMDKLIASLKKYNIEPIFSFIYGFPREKPADIEMTLDLYYKIYEAYRNNFFKRKAFIQLHKLMFLPGTDI